MALCAFLLGTAWPLLAAMPALPSRVLAGDVYAVTQGSGPSSVNESLAAALAEQPWADAVSREVLALSVVRGDPVLVRGVDLDAYAAIEALEGVPASGPAGSWALAGSGLAERLRLAPGDDVAVTGSTVARLAVLRLEAVVRAGGPADDELLVSLGTARFLTGLGPAALHSVRVRTDDAPAMLSFLEARGASVHVSGPGLARADVNSDPPAEERLTNLLLRSGRGSVPRDYLSAAVSEATASVRVVAWGFAGLVAVLVALGVHAVQARAFAERRGNVAVLRTLGASGSWVAGRALGEGLPWALGASVAGTAAGLALSASVPEATSLSLFGHRILAVPDVGVAVLAVSLVVIVSVTSQALLVRRALGERPGDVLRERTAAEPLSSLEVVLRG